MFPVYYKQNLYSLYVTSSTGAARFALSEEFRKIVNNKCREIHAIKIIRSEIFAIAQNFLRFLITYVLAGNKNLELY